MDKLSQFAINRLNQLFDTTAHAMPKIVNAVLAVTKMTCLVDILSYAFFLSLFLIALCVEYKFIKLGINKDNRLTDPTGWQVTSSFLGVALFLYTVVLIVTCPIWAFIGYFHPDIYLIHQAIVKVSH